LPGFFVFAPEEPTIVVAALAVLAWGNNGSGHGFSGDLPGSVVGKSDAPFCCPGLADNKGFMSWQAAARAS
jgi:hypothetical protein